MGSDDEGRTFLAHGVVELGGAQIGGYLRCDGGRFLDGDVALNMNGATVRGDVSLGQDGDDRPLIACGTVSLVGAEIKGQLKCTGGKFFKPAEPGNDGRAALAATLARIDGHVWFDAGFETDGCVNFDYAEIGGLLSFEQAKFARHVRKRTDSSGRLREGRPCVAPESQLCPGKKSFAI